MITFNTRIYFYFILLCACFYLLGASPTFHLDLIFPPLPAGEDLVSK